MQTILVLMFYLLWLAGICALVNVGLRMIPRARLHFTMHRASLAEDTTRFIQDQEHELWPNQKFDHLNCAICGPGPLMQGKVPSDYPHPLLTKTKERYFDGYGTSVRDKYEPSLPSTAEYVGSKILGEDGMHTVMLDLDYPVTLIQSTSTCHNHLYIDRPITWPQYKRLLVALWRARLIEDGYYKASVKQGQTFLRPPWVKKMRSR
jgi:hypothetical protein